MAEQKQYYGLMGGVFETIDIQKEFDCSQAEAHRIYRERHGIPDPASNVIDFAEYKRLQAGHDSGLA